MDRLFSINQADVRERNEQVRQMCDIYSKANRVVIFLGEERNDSGRAIDFILELGKDNHFSELFPSGDNQAINIWRSFRALSSILSRN